MSRSESIFAYAPVNNTINYILEMLYHKKEIDNNLYQIDIQAYINKANKRKIICVCLETWQVDGYI